MVTLRYFPLIGLIILLAGCAAKHQAQTELVIPRSALTKDIVLKGCNANVEPPKCKTAIVIYRKGSEQIQVVK